MEYLKRIKITLLANDVEKIKNIIEEKRPHHLPLFRGYAPHQLTALSYSGRRWRADSWFSYSGFAFRGESRGEEGLPVPLEGGIIVLISFFFFCFIYKFFNIAKFNQSSINIHIPGMKREVGGRICNLMQIKKPFRS